MEQSLYYLLTSLSLVFLILVILFSELEMIKKDKHGRDWDASSLIQMPIGVLCLILFVILAFQSWNVEIYLYNGATVSSYSVEYGYMAMVHFVFALITFALLVKNAFKFMQRGFELHDGYK